MFVLLRITKLHLKNKLGLSWAKLSSSWNWTLLLPRIFHFLLSPDQNVSKAPFCNPQMQQWLQIQIFYCQAQLNPNFNFN